MTEETKPRVVEIEKESSFTWAWIVLIILLLMIIAGNIFFKVVSWWYIFGFVLFVGILSTGLYIALKFGKGNDSEHKEIYNEGREIVPNPTGTEYLVHYAEYEGIECDFGNSEIFDKISLKAGETKGNFDTNVIITVFIDKTTKDDYWFFMNGVENEIFLKLEKFKKKKPFHSRDEKYIRLLKKLDIKIKKNPKDEKEIFNIIDSYAQKSTMSSIIKRDEKGNPIEQILFQAGRKEIVEEESEL